jgi:hypothetical protein
MITGAHAILYSDDANATRAALAKVLGTRAGSRRSFSPHPAHVREAYSPPWATRQPVPTQAWRAR